jgi:hypothetical protein
MSEHLQPGMHPDPDSLNAFMEGVLPEHERLACMSHFAECPQCREVVYLAQEALPLAPATVKPLFWKRWLTPIPVLSAATIVLSAATIAGLAVLSVSLIQRENTIVIPPAMPPMPPAAIQARPDTAPPQALRVAPPAKRQAPAAPLPVSGRVLPLIPLQPVANDSSAGVAGTVTDPAGSVITGAAVQLRPVQLRPVQLRPMESSEARSVSTNGNGQFNIAGLDPGRYELKVMAQGFQPTTKQVEVKPDQTAREDSTLSVGSASETVSVTASSPLSAAESGAFARKTATLVSRADTSVVNGKATLRLDAAGVLMRSQNAGKTWKPVKSVWHGRAVRLAASGAVFQLTTDTGEVWSSPDGNHWKK